MSATGRLHRLLAAGTRLTACLALVFFAGCDDGGDPGDPVPVIPEPYTGQAVRVEPEPQATWVDPETDIVLYYDGFVELDQLSHTRFLVNGEAVQEDALTYGYLCAVTLTPETPLAYHQYYTIEVVPLDQYGLREYSWRFATGPGPLGLFWEASQSPTGEDLVSVVGATFLSRWYALGADGALLQADYRFQWQEYTGGVGSGGDPMDWGMLEITHNGHDFLLLGGGGRYILKETSLSLYMGLWEFPADLVLLDINSRTDVLVGHRLANPGMGVICDGIDPEGIVETGEGRVMRASEWGFDNTGLYLAVGDEASIFLSNDGDTWQDVHHDPAMGSLRDVTIVWDNQAVIDHLRHAVAVGDVILRSEDGFQWTAIASGSNSALNAVARARYQDLMVAVGDGGVVLTSSDGQAWVPLEDLGVAVDLNQISFNRFLSGYGEQCVIVGDGGVIVTSPPRALDFAD